MDGNRIHLTPRARSAALPAWRQEDGYTLIEILVVILIVGILAAIALPTFLGQQKKGQDSSAKSDARNLVSHVEGCYVETQDYSECDTAAELGTTGLAIGAGQGQVRVSAAGTDTFTATAVSRSGNTFSSTRTSGGGSSHSCTTAGEGGCRSDGSW